MTLQTCLNKYISQIVTFIILLPISISFLLNPLTNDARIYQGVAQMTDYFGTFPSNIDLAWEIKPIGSRGISYLLYKIGSVFSTFGTYEYEIIIKFICLIVILTICYYLSTKFENKYVFILSVLALLTPLNFIALQAEWWACIIGLLILTLFLSDKKYNYWIAGCLVTIMFLCKGVSLILIVPIVCAVYLLRPDIFERIKIGAYGSILFLTLILYCGSFNHVISDMLMSANIAHVGYYSFIDMIYFTSYFSVQAFTYIPEILVGMLALGYIYLKHMRNRIGYRFTAIILMWASAYFIVFIQSEFFAYQYVVFIIPSIVTIILCGDKILKYGVVATFILFLLVTSHWSIGMSIENDFWKEKNIESINIINNFTDIKNQSSMLYLDPGDAPYYFRSNSSCRYISPLVFQRNSFDWDVSNLPQYQEEKECIMNYTGKYIITDAGTWFERNTTDNENVMKMIHSNYNLAWNKSWNIYIRNTGV